MIANFAGVTWKAAKVRVSWHSRIGFSILIPYITSELAKYPDPFERQGSKQKATSRKEDKDMADRAKSTRKRKIAEAYCDIQLAIGHLAFLEEAAHDSHPDIAELIRSICVGLAIASDGVEATCVLIFGGVPTSWDAWRHAGTHK